MTVVAKDSNISYFAYKDLSAICAQMPQFYSVQQRIHSLNEMWNISASPGGKGVQCSLENVLTERLEHFENVPDEIVVKLSDDGTTVGFKKNFVIITVTVLQEGQVAKTAAGNRVVAILKGKEDYDFLKTELSAINNEITQAINLSLYFFI